MKTLRSRCWAGLRACRRASARRGTLRQPVAPAISSPVFLRTASSTERYGLPAAQNEHSLFRSPRLSEREVDAIATHERMVALPERQHAVISQPRGSAPDNHVAVRQHHAHGCIRPLKTAEQEGGGKAQRDRDDRLTEVPLVLVLVQRQLCAGVRID